MQTSFSTECAYVPCPALSRPRIRIQIPTYRANPVQPECDKWCWFPVADRANAVKQWCAAADKDPSMIKAPWLLLLETDYVWVKPLRVSCSRQHSCHV